MKQLQNPYFVLVGLIAFMLIFAAAVSPSVVRYNTSADKAQVFSWLLDTITDAENDTLTFSSLQTSLWSAALQVDGKQLSGTQLIATIVQGSAFPSPDADQWVEITRDTVNGSIEQLRIDIGDLDYVNYRIILDGAGTQSSEYEAIVDVKKN